jgi:hypothetical protein
VRTKNLRTARTWPKTVTSPKRRRPLKATTPMQLKHATTSDATLHKQHWLQRQKNASSFLACHLGNDVILQFVHCVAPLQKLQTKFMASEFGSWFYA